MFNNKLRGFHILWLFLSLPGPRPFPASFSLKIINNKHRGKGNILSYLKPYLWWPCEYLQVKRHPMNVSQSTQVESVGGKMAIIKTIRRTYIILMLDITDQLKHKQVFVTNQICILSVVPPSCVLMPTDQILGDTYSCVGSG